jgi:hypothetical protein
MEPSSQGPLAGKRASKHSLGGDILRARLVDFSIPDSLPSGSDACQRRLNHDPMAAGENEPLSLIMRSVERGGLG